MVNSHDFVPNMWGRHYIDKDGNPCDLNEAARNGGQEIDPVQEQLDAWEQENWHSESGMFGPWMRAMQIMENRLRIEFAMHAMKYDQCKAGRCDIIYDLKEVQKLLNRF